MENPETNGPIFPSSSASNCRIVRSSAPPSPPSNFSSRAVQEALEHLACIDLSELFNEAKIEYCRAIRDIRSCGRYEQKITDVKDICMDETAVSSDAVTALLLDEKVVKDWVKRTFKNIATELQGIYYLEVEEMKNRLGSLLKFSVHMAGLSSVLEVLESSFKGRFLAQLHDLHHLQESILKTKQHLEITIWCIRHQFLEHVKSCHANFTSWHNLVCERRSAATMRVWPDAVDHLADSTRQDGSLFIDDALANLDIERAMERGLSRTNANGGLRWRSDETSDDEEQSPNRTIEVGATPMRGFRRRFARR